MKTSHLISRLALGLALTPALIFAAEKAQSTDSITQEAAVRAQMEATKTQVTAAKAQAEAAARAAKDATAKARVEVERAKIAEINGRIQEARAQREADLLKLAVAAKAPTEPVTFLGVMTAPAPSALTTQLGRPAGMGLVVVSVQPKSPAEEVLKVDDLLVRLDDQKLINNDQLTALIRGHQEGDEVTLTYVRGGKEATTKVKLVKQEAAIGKPVLKIAGLPNEEMRYALQGPDEWKIGSTLRGNTTVENGDLSQTFTYTHGIDGPTTEIKIVAGKKTVTLRNPGGGVEFSGPYDTEEERKSAPASVQTRVADVEGRIGRLQVMLPVKGGAVTIRPVAGNRIEVQLPGDQPAKVER